MQTLQIDKTNAKKLYPNATAEFKIMLEDTFGKQFFSQKAIDRIKTFKDACEDQGIDPGTAVPYPNPGNDHEEAVNGVAQIFIIAKSLNGDWKANFKNTSQYKYYPWFKDSGSGSGLSYFVCVRWRTDTACGVRLCYRDAETAEYAGKQFISIYNKFL
jgi:hypothetical protein